MKKLKMQYNLERKSDILVTILTDEGVINKWCVCTMSWMCGRKERYIQRRIGRCNSKCTR